MRLIKEQVTLFDAEAGATANSAVVPMQDFRNIMVVITAAGSYAGKVFCYGSFSSTAPSLASAASASNEYFPVEMKALNNDASILGTTGVVYAGVTDGVTGYAPNTDGLQWIGFKIADRTAGTLTLKVSACDNQ